MVLPGCSAAVAITSRSRGVGGAAGGTARDWAIGATSSLGVPS